MCHSLLLNSMETANEGQGKRNISTTLLLDRHWQEKKTKSLQGIIVFRGKKGEQQKDCVCVRACTCVCFYVFFPHSLHLRPYLFISLPASTVLELRQQLEVKILQNTHRFACAKCAFFPFPQQ